MIKHGGDDVVLRLENPDSSVDDKKFHDNDDGTYSIDTRQTISGLYKWKIVIIFFDIRFENFLNIF